MGIIILALIYCSPGKEYGTTEADEFRLMLVHAMLHLLGYDHIEDDEAEIMEKLLLLCFQRIGLLVVVLTRHH